MSVVHGDIRQADLNTVNPTECCTVIIEQEAVGVLQCGIVQEQADAISRVVVRYDVGHRSPIGDCHIGPIYVNAIPSVGVGVEAVVVALEPDPWVVSPEELVV